MTRDNLTYILDLDIKEATNKIESLISRLEYAKYLLQEVNNNIEPRESFDGSAMIERIVIDAIIGSHSRGEMI